MKRSEINRVVRRMERLAAEHGFCLPPFCGWTPEDWTGRGPAYDETRDNLLGWDITDYGTGDFLKTGFTLITLRNGNVKEPDRHPKPYAEKLLILEEGQYSPMHFHWNKMEDIINRGGGSIRIRVYCSTPEEAFGAPTSRSSRTAGPFSSRRGPRSSWTPGRASRSIPTSTTITILRWLLGPARCSWERFPCATTMKTTTGFMRSRAASRRSRRTSRLTGCCVWNIRKQKKFERRSAMELAVKTCTLDMLYEEMLDFCAAQGVSTLEIGTGNWSSAP